MSYTVEAGASRSRRARRRRAVLTLAVVALMLFFAFWYAYSYYQASTKPAGPPAPVCTTTPAAAPEPGDITVNVYNATDRNGLAARTATEVRKRGFKVATVANDPLRKTVGGTAEVRYGPSAPAAGKVVLTLVKGAKAVQDARTDGSVDLVLGEKFTALAPPRRMPTKPPTTAPTAGSGAGGSTASSTPAC